MTGPPLAFCATPTCNTVVSRAGQFCFACTMETAHPEPQPVREVVEWEAIARNLAACLDPAVAADTFDRVVAAHTRTVPDDTADEALAERTIDAMIGWLRVQRDLVAWQEAALECAGSEPIRPEHYLNHALYRLTDRARALGLAKAAAAWNENPYPNEHEPGDTEDAT